MGNEQELIPRDLLEELRCLNLDTNSLTWNITYKDKTVILRLQWLRSDKEHDYQRKNDECNVDSSCVESTSTTSIVKLNRKKQPRQSWSKWKIKKGNTYTKKRIGNTSNRVIRPIMGKDAKSGKSAIAVCNGASRYEQYPDSGTMLTDPAGIYDHVRVLDHSSVTLSPESSVSSSSISDSSSSHLEECSSSSSVVSTSSYHSCTSSFLPYYHGHTQKTLKFVKEETLSDGDLSESLPDLDDSFTCLDVVSVRDLSRDPEISNKCDRDVKRIELGGEKNSIPSEENLGMHTPIKEGLFVDDLQNQSEDITLAQTTTDKKSSDTGTLSHWVGDQVYVVSAEVKNKIANLLHISGHGKTENISSLTDDIAMSKQDEGAQENSVQTSLSGERHFLDVLMSSPSKRIKVTKSETDAVVEDIGGNEGLHKLNRNMTNISSPKSTFMKDLQTLAAEDKMKQQQRTSWSVKRKRHGHSYHRQLSISTFMKQTARVSKSLPVTHMTQTNCKILYPSFLDDFGLPDKAVHTSEQQLKFSPVELSAIDASIEEGNFFLKHTIDLTQVFSLYSIPTKTVVNHIYKYGLLGSTEVAKSLRSFHTLSYIQRKYPSAIKITWSMISEVMEKLGLDSTSVTTDKGTIFRSSLALQFIVQVLRGELRAISNISNSACIKRCQAYKVLSLDCGVNNLKQVIKWLSGALSCGEYVDLCNAYISLHFHDDSGTKEKGVPDSDQLGQDLSFNELKKVLPYLQELLEIGILVSSSNLDCARCLGFELVKVFYYLPNLDRKKLLLQTMTSDLLRFKLCQLFMEANCEVTECCFEFPTELVEVTERLFQAFPPKCQLTPPLTPSSDSTDDLDPSLSVSPERCEELCMLLYYAILSYIRCRKSECDKALRRRGSLLDKGYLLNTDDKRELQCNWECAIEAFRLKVLRWTVNVTPATEMFLNMLLCLGDASE